MYEYLTGVVTFINPYYIVVETNGIGYQIALGNPYRYSSKLNLKGKFGELSIDTPFSLFDEANTKDATALSEAMEALSALGYSDREIKRVEKQLKEVDNQTTDEYLRQALKLMMKK